MVLVSVMGAVVQPFAFLGMVPCLPFPLAVWLKKLFFFFPLDLFPRHSLECPFLWNALECSPVPMDGTAGYCVLTLLGVAATSFSGPIHCVSGSYVLLFYSLLLFCTIIRFSQICCIWYCTTCRPNREEKSLPLLRLWQI